MTSTFTRNAMLFFSFIFSLLIVGSLQIEAALIETADPPVQELNKEKLDLDLYNSKMITFVRLYRMSVCLSNFFGEINKSTFWHSHKRSILCRQEISPTKNESPFLYKACEFICGERNHQFMARNILYTIGLIGYVDKTDILFNNVSLSNDNNRIEYTVKINDKRKNTREYKLDIGKSTLQTIKKEDHDSSIILNNLRTIAAKDLLDSAIDKKKQPAWKRKWGTTWLFSAIGCSVILKIGKNRFSPTIILGTLFSSIMGFLFGKYHWKPNHHIQPSNEAQPSNEEIDNRVTSWLQPKLTCGVLRLEEEARIISKHLTNNANLPTWRKRKIDILEKNHNLPKVIAKLILEFTP